MSLLGRQWTNELVPLDRYMRRRDVPRMARQEEADDAEAYAEQALVALWPLPEFFAIFAQLARLHPSMAGPFYDVMIRQRCELAMAVNEYLSTHIPRPLHTGLGSRTIDFERWNTPAAFANTFR